MKRLRCEKCEITAARSWDFIWYSKTITLDADADEGEVPRTIERWLCPDCIQEFRSDRARNAFLRKGRDPGAAQA